jgi:hypothetical protein
MDSEKANAFVKLYIENLFRTEDRACRVARVKLREN